MIAKHMILLWHSISLLLSFKLFSAIIPNKILGLILFGKTNSPTFWEMEYHIFILSAIVYLPKNTESILGKIYFENKNNNIAKIKKTKVIW